MTDFQFNIAKGATAHYARLGAANDALIAVPLLAAGLESEAVMKDYDTLAQVLAGASDEATGLPRATLTSVTVAVDDTGDKVVVDAADVVWATPTGGATARLLICYDADTTGGSDTDIIPLLAYDFAATPAGAAITAAIHANGLASFA